MSDGDRVNVLFVFEIVGKEDILTQVLKLSEENCSEPEQVVSDVLVVTEVVSIDSEKVTEMLSVTEILLWLSVVEEIEETVGAVVSVVDELSEVLVELSEESSEDEVVLSVLAVVSLSSSDSAHEETITARLTTRTNQDNNFFISFLNRNCLWSWTKVTNSNFSIQLMYSQKPNFNLSNSF